MMKFLLVNKFHYLKGGAETYYFSLAEGLKKAGHEVIFFSMKHADNICCKQEKYFVSNKEYVNKSSFFSKLNAFRTFIYSNEAYNNLKKLIEDEKPDVAILNNIHRQLTTSVVDALYDCGVPIYWVVHDLILLCPNYTMLNGKGEICEKCCNGNYNFCIKYKCVKSSYLKSWLAAKESKFNRKRKIVDKVTKFITPSEFYRQIFIKYGFDENKIIHLTNPLRDNFKFELNNFNDDYYLYFGRLSYEKGIIELVKSFKSMNNRLIILGTGELRETILGVISLYNLNDRVQLLGFKKGKELVEIIKHAKFIVVPSKWYENCPYSVMESMALGKPVIVSNFGGLPELVKDEETGFIYKDDLSLILNLSEKIDDSEYGKLCANSLNFAKELFNMKKYVINLLDLITSKGS